MTFRAAINVIAQIICAPLALSALTCLPATAAEIRLVADIWCPYNCEPNSDHPGLMIEIASKVFAPTDRVTYQILPWSRAIEYTRAGQYDGLIGAAVGDAPDFIYPTEPQSVAADTIVSRIADHWQFDGWTSLKGRRLASVKDYNYGDAMTDYLNKAAETDVIYVVGGDEPLKKLVPMLIDDRIDGFVENIAVARYFLMTNHHDDKLRVSPPIGRSNLYIGFSPALPGSPTLAKKLAAGMVQLREIGELAKILANYGLKDWQ